MFDFRFFYESVSPKPLRIQKFAEIFAAQGASPVLLTPVTNGKNLQKSEKFGHLLVIELTYSFVPRAPEKEDPNARKLLRRADSAGPVSPTCFDV